MKNLDLFGSEAWEEALEADIHAAGGPKVIGNLLWPDLGPIEGAKKLRRIVNREHKQRLNENEKAIIIHEAAKRGSRRMVEFYCKLGRAKAVPVAPEDSKAAVVEEFERIKALAPNLMKLIADAEQASGYTFNKDQQDQ